MVAETATIRVLDLETTDFPPEGQVVELGYVDMRVRRQDPASRWEVLTTCSDSFQKFFKPDKPVSLEARATHHIKDSELAEAEHHGSLLSYVLGDGVRLYCAHNADFEKQFITLPDGSYWLDTYKIALRLYPNSPRHTNQFLRYMLNLDLDEANAAPPHRALPDAYVTAHLLAEMLKFVDIKEAIKWSADVAYLTKIGFGKHFGKRFEDVPKDYLRWILAQADMDPAVHAAARRHLNN